MSAASRTLGAIGVVIAMSIPSPGATLHAQARDAAAPSPFDPIARRVLVLKVESQALRDRLNEGWPPPGWTDSLAAMRAGVALLMVEALRLKDQARTVAPQLLALVERAGVSLETLGGTRDQRSARTALAHLSAGLDALQQKISEGEAREE